MTPQEAVSAFFNTMRSETDQAGLMYSQFAVVQALDYVIDRWEDLNPLARDKAGNRTREWLEHLETVFGGMSTEELCAHKFDFSAELRWAMGGIGTSVMLGLSRAIGETMVVLMVAGGAGIIPESIFDPVRPMTAGIAAEMAEAAVGGEHYHALYAAGLLLFLITFAFNLAAWYFTRRLSLRSA